MNNILQFQGQYRWLSNFWLTPIFFNGHVYPSAENAYQASKAPADRQKEFISITPGQSKRLGRLVKIPNNWENIKVKIMGEIISNKFKIGSELADKLTNTGNSKLVEGNNWGDIFWGVCNGIG